MNTTRRFFSPPVFPGDENLTRLAYYISIIVPSAILILILLMVTRIRRGAGLFDLSVLMLAVVIGILLVAWAVLKSGAVKRAGYITIGATSLASAYLALSGNGLRGAGFTSFFVVMLLAGLLHGSRAAVGVAVLAVLTGFGHAYAETAGLLDLPVDTPLIAAVKYAFLFVMSAVIIRSIIHNLQNALNIAAENSRQLASTNQELTRLRDDLELRIQEKKALRGFEFDYRQAVKKDVDRVMPFVKSLRDLMKKNPYEFLVMDLAMKNGDIGTVREIARKNGISLDQVEAVLADIHERIKSVGYEIGYLPGYFPRKIKNKEKFMRIIMENEKLKGEIELAIQEKSDELGRYLTQEEKINLINSFIRGFKRSRILLAKTGNMKTRMIDKNTPELNETYYTTPGDVFPSCSPLTGPAWPRSGARGPILEGR